LMDEQIAVRSGNAIRGDSLDERRNNSGALVEQIERVQQPLTRCGATLAVPVNLQSAGSRHG